MGKFIVFYGINNLGKSTQAKLLVETLISEGQTAEYLKYPIYDKAPSGPFLNQYLREGNPWHLSPREAQIMYAFNRAQYETELLSKLQHGTTVVAEDYWGTGVAWGVGPGVDKEFMLELNKYFYKEDLALLFEGKRFSTGVEQGHLHESNNPLMEKVEQVFSELADQNNWQRIQANESIEVIQKNIWEKVKSIL